MPERSIIIQLLEEALAHLRRLEPVLALKPSANTSMPVAAAAMKSGRRRSCHQAVPGLRSTNGRATARCRVPLATAAVHERYDLPSLLSVPMAHMD
jgi:hypothetical protein